MSKLREWSDGATRPRPHWIDEDGLVHRAGLVRFPSKKTFYLKTAACGAVQTMGKGPSDGPATCFECLSKR